jgi:hypothetical protein
MPDQYQQDRHPAQTVQFWYASLRVAIHYEQPQRR